LFEIEKSALLHSLKGDVKCAEFLWYQHLPLCLWVVEAKTSCPTSTEAPALRDKLVNTMTLCVATLLGQHAGYAHELPPELSLNDLTHWDTNFLIVLAKPQPEQWLVMLQNEMNKLMLPFLKTWGFKKSSVKVVTVNKATTLGLPILSNAHDPQ
jgi:hypothetical protein